jgi:hypothetical protein
MKKPLDPEFQIDEAVRWKKANPTDPRNNMRIRNIFWQEALCMCVETRGSIQDSLSARPPIVEGKDHWFPLSELEHVSETP